MYDFAPFIDAVEALGLALIPLAVPAIATWLVLHWVADLIFRS